MYTFRDYFSLYYLLKKNFEKERTKAILPNITTIEDAYRKKKNKEHLEKKYMYI